MTIPFERVFRMKCESSPWSIVMGVTPIPGLGGLWMLRASLTHPETAVYGEVFEGQDGKFVVIGKGYRWIFEPLTLETWEDMREDVHGFDELRKSIKTDVFLQSWYWDEFSGDLDQETVLQRLTIAAQNA